MQATEERKIHAKIKQELENRNQEMQKSIRQIPKETNKPPNLSKPQKNPPSSEETQSSVVNNLQQQQVKYESLMTPNPYEELEEEDTSQSEMELETRREMNRKDAGASMPSTPLPQYERNPRGLVTGKKRGRPPGGTNRPKAVIEAEKNKPKGKRGRPKKKN